MLESRVDLTLVKGSDTSGSLPPPRDAPCCLIEGKE